MRAWDKERGILLQEVQFLEGFCEKDCNFGDGFCVGESKVLDFKRKMRKNERNRAKRKVLRLRN